MCRVPKQLVGLFRRGDACRRSKPAPPHPCLPPRATLPGRLPLPALLPLPFTRSAPASQLGPRGPCLGRWLQLPISERRGRCPLPPCSLAPVSASCQHLPAAKTGRMKACKVGHEQRGRCFGAGACRAASSSQTRRRLQSRQRAGDGPRAVPMSGSKPLGKAVCSCRVRRREQLIIKPCPGTFH